MSELERNSTSYAKGSARDGRKFTLIKFIEQNYSTKRQFKTTKLLKSKRNSTSARGLAGKGRKLINLKKSIEIFQKKTNKVHKVF